jgi:hypothetical protein
LRKDARKVEVGTIAHLIGRTPWRHAWGRETHVKKEGGGQPDEQTGDRPQAVPLEMDRTRSRRRGRNTKPAQTGYTARRVRAYHSVFPF